MVMPKKKIRMAIFTPIDNVIQRTELMSTRDDLEIQIFPQVLDDAIPFCIELEKEGVEVIVTRRATAHLLRKVTNIPVLSFPKRSIDILIGIEKALKIGKKILVPMYKQPMGGLSVLETLLDVKLEQLIFVNKESLKNLVRSYSKKDFDVIVGGPQCCKFAEMYGLPSVETRHQEYDIDATLENAISSVMAFRQQRVIANEYRSVIDATSDGIIATDNKGLITKINLTGREYLQLSEEDVIGTQISRHLKNCPSIKKLPTRRSLTDQLGKIGKNQFVFNHTPIRMENEIIGTVTTFRNITNVQRSEHAVRRSLSKGFKTSYRLEDLIHESPSMHELVEMGRQYAKIDSTVLVMGETGTGKEMLVQGIHNAGPRCRKPFVSINCAALPEQLLESELFGYEEGAFTGSRKGGKAGLFELAHQGSIFLDEIDSTPLSVQVKLLRVLQEREVMRIGGDRRIPIDVRVFAAAIQNLKQSVDAGNFRADLYYRLNVLRITVPPLRKRREDIPTLLNFFISLFSERIEAEPIILPEPYTLKLVDYRWPGNVRQLKNFTEQLVMNCTFKSTTQTLVDLYNDLIKNENIGAIAVQTLEPTPDDSPKALESGSDEVKAKIEQALVQTKYNRQKAAELLQISRSTLWRKMKELKLG